LSASSEEVEELLFEMASSERRRDGKGKFIKKEMEE